MTVLKCLFNGIEVETCSDSGSDLVVLGWNHYKSLCHKLGYEFNLQPTRKLAWAANGTNLNFVGKTMMTISNKHASKQYPVFVQKGFMRGFPLLSEDCLIELGYIRYSHDGSFAKKHNSVNSVTLDQDGLSDKVKLKLTKLHDRYKGTFRGLGRLKNFHAKFTVKAHAQGFVKTCLPVPLHLQKIVKDKLYYLIENKVLEFLPPNTPARYVCSLICIPKPNNDVRICANLKPLNDILEKIPSMCAPRIEQFQDKLKNCAYFGCVDVRESYYQIAIDHETSNLCVISTPIGILRFRTLPMGASPSGQILDERMAVILKDCRHSINVRDDVIFGSDSLDGLYEEYELIVKAMHENNITLNDKKVKFGLREIDFYGQTFSANGMRPSKARIDDLKKAKFPVNQRGVLSFVCMLQWLERYILRYSEESRILRELSLSKGPMKATEAHTAAFEKLKNIISEDTLLYHFNPSFKTVVFADSGKTAHQPGDRGGLCGVLAQIDPQFPKEYKPVSFCSRAMSDVEGRWAQVEGEALAIVWSVLKYSYFLEGCPHFTVYTDCSSLIPMFKKLHPGSCPKRIFGLFLKIQHFNMSLEFRVGRANPSDFLSRAANQAKPADDLIDTADLELAVVQSIRQESDKMCLSLIREATLADPELQSVTKRIGNNDWNSYKKELKPFFSQREEFYLYDDIVFRGNTIVVPSALRQKVAQLIHSQGHLGMTGTQKLLRQYFWFPGFSNYCIAETKKCSPCQFSTRPQTAQPGGFFIPKPICFSSVSSDYKGPLKDGKYILGFVCLYSGFAEVFSVNSTSFQIFQPIILDYMARHSKMENFVSDNGAPYSSQNFIDFCDKHNIKRRPVIELHPSANGNIESFWRSVDKSITRASILKSDYKMEISHMLIAKNACPHPGTLKSPHELAYGKRANLNLLPDYQFPDTVDSSGAYQNLLDYKKATKARHDSKRAVQDREFHVNDIVLLCLDLSAKKKKYSQDLYQVIDVKPSYLIATRLKDGQTLRRHKNHFQIYVDNNTNQHYHQQHSSVNPKQQLEKNIAAGRESDFYDDYDDGGENIPRAAAAPGPPQLPPVPPQQQPQVAAPHVPAAQVPPAANQEARPAQVPQQLPQRQQQQLRFHPRVNVQEIENNNIGRRVTRSRGPVESHPNVQPSILELSLQQQGQARDRVQQFQQHQQQQPQENEQNV